ncbi:MAG: drug efflux transport system permease protein [Thermoplasmata archaeon]|jgi:ABC-2 type transport system permease protein|nr:drug efflux transport system permease protein [Thermoplasmata archaeon]
MIVVDITIKTLKEAVRQPRNLALTLGLPLAFMVIFGLAFGGASTTTYKVAVVNEDAGAAGAQYVARMADPKYESGKPMLDARSYHDEASARGALQSRDVDLVAILPAGFSADLGAQAAKVTLVGDPGSAASNAARSVMDAYTQRFAAQASGRPPPIALDEQVVTHRETTQFDVIAPGLMVYAVLALAPQAAGVLARETELKTLDRIRLSPTRALSLLAGVALAELVLAVVSLSLMMVAARAMGFHAQGSWPAALAIALVAALAVLGIGLLIASFARTQQEAANLGVLVSVPASFLSGAFFAVPGATLFRVGGHAIGAYDALPTTHAVAALRQVLTFGRPLADQAWALSVMAVLALLYFAGGVLLYRRARLAPE